MRFPSDATIALHALYHRREANGYLIGDPETGETLPITPAEMRVLDLFKKGLTIEHVLEMVREEKDAVDVYALLDELASHRFIHKVGRRVLSPTHEPLHELTIKVPWLGGKSARFIYILLSLFGVLTFLLAGSIPTFHDFFATQSLTTTLLMVLVSAWGFVFLRQLVKHAAAQSLGLQSRIGVANHYHVFAPKTYTGNATPEQRHYIIGVSLASLTALASVFLLLDTYAYTSLWSLLFAIAFVEILAEALLFLDTDLAKFISHTTRIHRLNKQTAKTLKADLKLFWRGKGAGAHPTVTSYAFFYIVSILLAGLLIIAYVLPAMLAYFTRALLHIASATPSPAFVDALIALLFFTAELLLYGFALVRHHPLSHNALFTNASLTGVVIASFFLAVLGTTIIDFVSLPLLTIVLILVLGAAITFMLGHAVHEARQFSSRATGLFETALLPVLASTLPLAVLFATPYGQYTWLYAFSLGAGMFMALPLTSMALRGTSRS